MSTKSPPKKALPLPVLTRTKAVVLNTRQLRRKEGSFRKISEMTQMLLTPITELTPKVKPKRSPKDKSAEKPRPDVKKVMKQVLGQAGAGAAGPRGRGRKRKVEGAAVSRKKAASSAPAALPPSRDELAGAVGTRVVSVRELIELADARELADDDLAEILTCESPVWWEDPPDDSYTEEPICPETLYEETQNSNKLKPVSISIPCTKHIDYKFMKKRVKLETVLGNLKSKMLKEKKPKFNTESDRSQMEINKCEKEIDETITVDNTNNALNHTVAVKEETEVKRVKKSSESTEGDSILGLNNEDLLRDLENIDIPMEAEGNIKTEDNSDKDYDEISSNSQDVDLNPDQESDETAVIESDVNITDGVSISSDSSIVSQNDDSQANSEENHSEQKPLQENTPDAVSMVSNTLSDAVSLVSNTASYTVSDTNHSSSPANVPDSDSHNSVDHETDEKIECEVASDEYCNRNCDDGDVIEEYPIEVTDNESITQISQESDVTDNLDSNIKSDEVTNEETDDSVTKTDIITKQTKNDIKTNKLDKEQLLAVYKTIVDTNFTINLNESEVANSNVVVINDKNVENVTMFYKKCKNMKRANKIELTNEESKNTDVNTNVDEDVIKIEQVLVETDGSPDKHKSCICSQQSDARSIKFSIIPDGKSAKYCLNCSSIFETDTCCYCENRLRCEAPCQSCKV